MYDATTSAFGNTARMALPNSIRPSTDTIVMSSTPWFLILFRTPNQYFAFSLPPIHIPSTFRIPFDLTSIILYTAFYGLVIFMNIEMHGTYKNNRILAF